MKSTRFVLGLALMTTLSFTAASAFSAEESTWIDSKDKSLVEFWNTLDLKEAEVTEAQYQAFKNQPDSKLNRKIADASLGLANRVSTRMKEIKTRLESVDTAEELDAFIADLDAHYAENKDFPDVQLLTLELAQLRPLRGIVYRLAPLAMKAKVTHSMLLTRFMKLATRIGMYSPTRQTKTVFAYLTEPYTGVVPFTKAVDFQHYVGKEIYAATWNANLRLGKLNLSSPIVIDNSIFYTIDGTKGFKDELAQYNLFQEGERQLLMAIKDRAMKNQQAFTAFYIDDFMALSSEIGKLYGIEQVRDDIEGVPTMAVATKIRQSKYKNMFKFYRNVGPEAMKRAFFHTKMMVEHMGMAQKALKGDGPKIDTSQLINPAVANSFSETYEKVLPKWEQMVKGRTTLVSNRTGETVVVDIPAYYQTYINSGKLDPKTSNPMFDLRRWMPKHFVQTSKYPPCSVKNEVNLWAVVQGHFAGGTHTVPGLVQKMTGPKGDVPICFRDYFYGSPDGWEAGAYNVLFPGVAADKVGTAQRILKQSDGGRLVANLLDWVID